MSEQAQEIKLDPKVVYVPIAYDPEPARRKRKRGARRKLDPEPARRRRRVRRLDPIRGASGRTLVDSVVDGVALGYVSSKIPWDTQLGPITAKEVIAFGLAMAYEKAFMRRGWLVSLIGGLTAFATKRWLSG
ncbi:MAG: hypothetical protein QXE51_04015 [Nitrososphaeria archaeon]